MADLDYVKIVGRLGITRADGVDEDGNPDTVWCDSGSVLFEPIINYTKVAGGIPSPWMAGHAIIEATVDSAGYISLNGVEWLWLVDLGSSKMNPSIARDKAAYKVTFKNVQAAGADVTFPQFTFHPLPADLLPEGVTANDLTLLAPVPVAGGQSIVVGPAGKSVSAMSIVGGDLVTTLSDGTELNAGELPVGPGGSNEGVAGYITVDGPTKAALSDTIGAEVTAQTPKAVARLPLNVPTYDGNPSAGHPDVVHVPAGWNGYKYWMAFTPFPSAPRENPSIVASNDGVKWEIPAGLTNPIVPFSALPAGYDWWSDTDMVLSADGTTMMLYFRGTNQGVTNTCYLTTSTDGITWTPFQQVVAGIEESPAVVVEPGGGFTMFTCGENTIYRRTSADGITWAARTVITSRPTVPAPYVNVWHIDVVKVDGTYHALVDINTATGGPDPYRLFHWTSADGLAWTGPSTPAVPLSGSRFDKRGHYRSTLQPAAPASRPVRRVDLLDGRHPHHPRQRHLAHRLLR